MPLITGVWKSSRPPTSHAEQAHLTEVEDTAYPIENVPIGVVILVACFIGFVEITEEKRHTMNTQISILKFCS